MDDASSIADEGDVGDQKINAINDKLAGSLVSLDEDQKAFLGIQPNKNLTEEKGLDFTNDWTPQPLQQM